MSPILHQALIHGALLCLGMSVFIFGSLYQNPKIWTKSSPPDVQAFLGEPDAKTQIQRRRWGSLMMLLLLAVFGSLAQNTHLLGGGWMDVFWSSYVCFSLFNLFDAAVIDLGLVWLKPRWAFAPGVIDIPGLYDPKWHIKNFLIGVLVGVPVSTLVAFITSVVLFFGGFHL